MCKATEISLRVYQHAELSLVVLLLRAFCTAHINHVNNWIMIKMTFIDAYFHYAVTVRFVLYWDLLFMPEIIFKLTCFSVCCSSSSPFKVIGELELLCIAVYVSAKELLDAFQTACEWRLDVDVVTPPLSSASAIPTSSSKWVTACGNTEIKWKVMGKIVIKAFSSHPWRSGLCFWNMIDRFSARLRGTINVFPSGH